MRPTNPYFVTCYKLFEDYGGFPRSLVHGMPAPIACRPDRRSRLFETDVPLEKEPGTKGFNVFSNMGNAIEYLPRFKVRAHDLYLVRIYAMRLDFTPGSHYMIADTIWIPSEDWDLRTRGEFLL